MKITFAEAFVIVDILREKKKMFEEMHETKKEDADGNITWTFIEENLEPEQKTEYNALKALIKKFTSTEL